MRRSPVIAAAAALVLAFVSTHAELAAQPPRFPPVRAPLGNPITPNKVLLGKALFFEEQMSATKTMACATCHGLRTGGVDHRVTTNASIHPGRDGRRGTPDDVRGSLGVIGNSANGSYRSTTTFGLDVQVTGRRAQSVINAAFGPSLFWDGRAPSRFVDPADGQTVVLADRAALESQVAEPPVSDVEMAHFGEKWADVASRLASAKPLALASNVPTALANFVANKSYADLFAAAFGTNAVTPARIAMAIATYERTLIANQSPFDDFVRGNQNALTQSQQRGRNIFFGRNTRCGSCHQGPLLTDNQFHNTGVRPPIEDLGRQIVTNNTADRGRFRTPGLRNVGLRTNFFHNGQQRTLMDVVNFYNRGGDSNDNKDQRIRRLRLNPGQRQDLVNFMMALTDPRVAAGTTPFDSPTLYSASVNMPVEVGTGTAGSGAIVPEMIANEPPFLGNSNLTVGVRRGLGGAPALLALDTDATTTAIPIGGARIHLTLTAGLILAPAGSSSGTGHGEGYTSQSYAIPNLASLRGVKVGAQWVLSDTGNGNSFSATAAARLTIF